MAITLHDTPAALASPALPVADPCVLVIFGATGDLAKRKLLPALYNLGGEGCLSSHFLVLGTGRSSSMTKLSCCHARGCSAVWRYTALYGRAVAAPGTAPELPGGDP